MSGIRLDYGSFALSVASSMVGGDTLRLLKTAKRLEMVVLWPDLWSGVQRQLAQDLTRETLYWNGKRVQPRVLMRNLLRDHGVLWSRWAGMYLNQAPMADVFRRVCIDAQKRYGSHVMICETRPANALRINVESHKCKLALVFRKDFRVVDTNTPDMEELGTVRTHFRIDLRPQTSATLKWKWKSEKL